jgi:hypothetical protein
MSLQDWIARMRERLPKKPMRVSEHQDILEANTVCDGWVIGRFNCGGWTTVIDDAHLHADAINAMSALLDVAEAHRNDNTPRTGDTWHEDDGVALWFALPIDEPPYCGSPLDDDFPWVSTPFQALHWVPLPSLFRRGPEALDRLAALAKEPQP